MFSLNRSYSHSAGPARVDQRKIPKAKRTAVLSGKIAPTPAGRFPGPPKNPQAGLALVLALSLMAFVLLLLLSLVTLVRVEFQAAARETSALQARQNALMGIQVGLGRLQRSVGRDRVATGTIGVDGELVVDESKRYWTGVWRNPGSFDAVRNLMDYTESDLAAVLVSGENVAANLADSADPRWPILLGAPSLDTEGDTVQAPAVEIEGPSGQPRGRFAYWVADEGVKARVDLSDPAERPASDPAYQDAESVVRLFSPPRSGTERMLLEESPVGDKFPSDPYLLSRVADINSLGHLFPAGEAFARSRFHDLTVHSQGLFTDQRLGGLRRDLTWMLRNDALPTGRLYEEPVELNDRPGPLPGPTWSLLQDYYETAGSGEITLVEADSTRRQDDDDHRNNVSPIVTQVRLYFNFAFGEEDPGVHGGRLRMYLFPVVVLNNPYNRPLAATTYRFRFAQHNVLDSTELKVRVYEGDGSRLRTFEGDGYKFKDTLNALFDPKPLADDGRSDRSGVIRFAADGVAFEPGETKVLALESSGPYRGSLNSAHVSDAHGANPENGAPHPLVPGEFDDSKFAYVEFEDALAVGEKPEFYDFELVNEGQLRFQLTHDGGIGDLLASFDGVAYSAFDELDQLGLDLGLPPSAFVFPEAGFTYRMNLGGVAHLADFNPRSNHITLSGFARTYEQRNRPPRLYEGDFGQYDLSDDPGSGYFGPSHKSVGLRRGLRRTALFEMPGSQDDFVSLAQLKHVDLSIKHLRPGQQTDQTNYNAPAYVFGNSRADPRVGTGFTYRDYLDTPRWYRLTAAFDHSYRANEALWDGFFFSTAPDAPGERPLNRRIVPETPGWGPPDGPYAAAENLSLAGAFNVNSLSENAWRAVLSGLRDHDLETVAEGSESEVDFLYGSIARPLQGSFSRAEVDDGFSGEVWNGGRRLEPAEIDALAEAIVAEIAKRGPFLSLAHFVNRSLQGPAEVVEEGALQAAIDNADLDTGDPGLNEGLRGGDVTAADIDLDVPDESLFATHAFRGAPGRLTQADLLSALGPVLSARSDTFRIRAYGGSEDAENPSNAWCEAIVRRIPNKVNPDEAVEAPSPETSFGRRFEVVSFQWLPPQENPTP